GEPFLLDWTGSPNLQITDIFNAMLASFATPAGIAWDTSTCAKDADCVSTEVCQCTHNPMATDPTACVGSTKGQCGDKNCGTDGYCLVYPASWIFGVRPLVYYVQGTAGVPQPAL